MTAIGNTKYKYRAFVSYSHVDTKWADRIHRFLETYRVPKHLVGRPTSRGPIPRRLNPVFRDRDELPSATNLGAAIDEALADSACLIVICSPDAARSRWVNEEIRKFKLLGGSDRIFSLIVSGEPFAPAQPGKDVQECLPEALRFELGPDGQVSNVPAEPIAADARRDKDGPQNARLKLIAGMLGVGFDDLRQREQHRRQRRMAIVTAASLTGMIVAFVLATMAWMARAEAERQRVRAEAEAETSRQTTSFLVELFNVADPSESRGDEYTAHEILDRGAERIERDLAGQTAIQATLMETLGTVYTGLGSVRRATPMLRQAVARRRSLHANLHEDVAGSLNKLGNALKLSDEYEEAERVLRESLEIRRRVLGEDHPDVAQSLNDLGDILSRLGDYSAAENLFREALALRTRHFGNDHPDTAQSLEDLALSLFDQGDYDSPVPLLRRAVAIRYAVDGDPHPDLAEALNNLGFVLGELGELDEAERLYRDSLDMKRRLFTEPHAEIAMSLNNVAFALHDKGEFEEAEAAYREALAMQRQVFGDDHTDVAESLNNLAYLLYDKGNLTGAIERSEESLAIYQSVLGSGHPEVIRSMNNLALWQFETGDHESAERLLQRSLDSQGGPQAEKHPNVASSMALLAHIFVESGRFEEARQLAAQARDIFAVTLPENHWRTSIADAAEGAALSGLERFEDAEILLLNSYEVFSSRESALPIFATQSAKYLMLLYQRWGRLDEADRFSQILSD